MYHDRKIDDARRSTPPASRIASRASAVPARGLSGVVEALFYAGAALGAAALLFSWLSTALGDPSMAGLLTTLAAITLLPFLGLGEDRAL